MDKNAIKKFAVWARRELIEKVTKKATLYGVTSSEVVDADADVVNGMVLSEAQKKERKALIDRVFEKGYEQVMEEVAYTWFNRFCALRFMEVNNYLPSYVRVFTNEDNKFKPQILAEALSLDLDGLDKEVVHRLKLDNKDEELYKYLLITQCNALNAVLPKMFQKIQDYTELLFPDNLLREGSVVEQMVSNIPEKDWKDTKDDGQGVEIVGWLYQFYMDEPHNQIVSINKSIVKKEDIPAATALYTTDWVVHYIVDNSVGRYWIERNRESKLAEKLQFFVKPKNGEIKYVEQSITPQEITVLDPCMGSGHFLTYAFDVLMEIYRECGYSDRDAAKNIIEHNLYGLDIDKRAHQLAYFAVMMKARKYDRRLFSRGLMPNIFPVKHSRNIGEAYPFEASDFLNSKEHQETINYLIDVFKNADELGTIIRLEDRDYEGLLEAWNTQAEATADTAMLVLWEDAVKDMIVPLIQQAIVMNKKYAAVVTNPPYLNKMDTVLKKYVSDNYASCKSDLFSVFMYRNFDFCIKDGYSGFMTPFVWMFIKSYEALRKFIIEEKSITTLIQFEYSAFEEATVPICSFVMRNSKNDSEGLYFRLSDFKGGMEVQKEKVLEALYNADIGYFYEANQENFSKIPGSPIAYWVSKAFIKVFDNDTISDYGFAGIGMRTGDNERFLRKWYEVNEYNMILNCTSRNKQIESYKKWVPYNKGGEYRKWYGNNEYLVNWFNDGFEIKENTKRVYPQLGDNLGWKISNEQYYYKKGITWTGVSSGTFSCRCYEEGFIFDSGANGLFANIVEDRYYLAAFLNTNLSNIILKVMNPTINTGSGTVGKLPLVYSLDYKSVVINIAKKNIILSHSDWDSFETSWDFQKHPMIMNVSRISDAYAKWSDECAERFEQLKANEEELNRIFIDIYGLQDELTPEVEDKEVTVNRFYDSKKAIPESMKGSSYALTKLDAVKSFISYAVGCMFGRYSLDKEGLIYAGGEWDDNNYRVFAADKDAIIPVCDDEYFEDDIVGRFINFVKVVYGESDLEDNLQFIADTLGGNGSARDVIRNYFTNGFYADHCKTYQKRPIYWLFDSGKKNGFKCLVYMHRYQKDTIARIRTDYLHEQQARYRTAIADLQAQIAEAATSTRVRLQKQLKKLQEQADEALAYEEKIHHMADQMIGIDLDDGVKHNYEIFKDVLAKIK